MLIFSYNPNKCIITLRNSWKLLACYAKDTVTTDYYEVLHTFNTF